MRRDPGVRPVSERPVVLPEPGRCEPRRTDHDRETLVSALAWWLIPIGATVLAVLFVMFRSRPTKPASVEDGMTSLKRMAQAMERPLPDEGPIRRQTMDGDE